MKTYCQRVKASRSAILKEAYLSNDARGGVLLGDEDLFPDPASLHAAELQLMSPLVRHSVHRGALHASRSPRDVTPARPAWDQRESDPQGQDAAARRTQSPQGRQLGMAGYGSCHTLALWSKQ